MRGSFLTSGYAAPAEEGLRCWDYDTQTGTILQRWGLRGLNSPTYLLCHPNGRVLYSGEKGTEPDPNGFLVTYALEEDGAKVLSRLNTGGVSPCHLSMDEQSEFLFVSNYEDAGAAGRTEHCTQQRRAQEAAEGVQKSGPVDCG